ncbi:unnamed protein product [Gadus morhua 'NCC']
MDIKWIAAWRETQAHKKLRRPVALTEEAFLCWLLTFKAAISAFWSRLPAAWARARDVWHTDRSENPSRLRKSSGKVGRLPSVLGVLELAVDFQSVDFPEWLTESPSSSPNGLPGTRAPTGSAAAAPQRGVYRNQDGTPVPDSTGQRRPQ